MFIKSFLKWKIIAIKEPRWRQISSCSEAVWKSLNFVTKIKCAEELTGINSKKPWIIANTEVSMYFEIIKKLINNQILTKIKQLPNCISSMLKVKKPQNL